MTGAKARCAVVLLVAVPLSAAPLVSCARQQASSAPPAPLVRALQVTAKPREPIELRGSVAARSRIKLGFKLAGVVAEVRVEQGDAVRKGQLLATLDEVDARSQLRVALAARDKARRDADRAARLVQEGAMATSVRDDAKSQLDAAEARAAQAQDAVARTRLTAPASGTVFARMAEPGETVDSGVPVLVLDTTDALVVKAVATARELGALRVGQQASLSEDAGGPSLAGRVTSLATTPNASDGLYAIEVTPAGSGRLRPGALVRIRFEATVGATALRIPLEALVHRQDRDFVFVLDGAQVRQVPVEVDDAEGREIAVRSGLRGGQRIVAEGAYFLQDGQSVRTLE